jgi:hypothetical protein
LLAAKNMMVKFILFALISAYLLKDVTAVDCETGVTNCYRKMFQTIQARDNVTYSMTYSSYGTIFSTAFNMWEGYQAICRVQNDLQTCLQNGGYEGCIKVNDLVNVSFVRRDNPAYAQSYVFDYLRYNYLCSELNNTNRDTHKCVRDNLMNIPSANCSNYQSNNDGSPDCFTRSIYLECVNNYANAVCGEQSQCITKKLHTLSMCSAFDSYYGGINQPSCGVCTSTLVGSTDLLKDVCKDTNQDNAGTLSTLPVTLLFFVTLVFQLFVKN